MRPLSPATCALTTGRSWRGERPATDEFRAGAGSRSHMAKLIYLAIGSLDGYVEDASGKFEWAAPDDEVHAFVNEVVRPTGTYLYGRRMYETMVFWETVDPAGDLPAVAREFAAMWQAAEKVVYSRTLETVSSARTRIERELETDAIERMKQSSGADI